MFRTIQNLFRSAPVGQQANPVDVPAEFDRRIEALSAKLTRILEPDELALMAVMEDLVVGHLNSAGAVLRVLNDAAERGQRKVPIVKFAEALRIARPT